MPKERTLLATVKIPLKLQNLPPQIRPTWNLFDVDLMFIRGITERLCTICLIQAEPLACTDSHENMKLSRIQHRAGRRILVEIDPFLLTMAPTYQPGLSNLTRTIRRSFHFVRVDEFQ